MEAPASKKQLALDSNIVFDLAEDRDYAHDFRESYQERGYLLAIPPTVVQELTYLALEAETDKSALALKALREMRGLGLLPFDLIPTGHAVTEQFSRKLICGGLIPDGEFNDGLILAETALAFIPLLATSDHHILDIDNSVLRVQFEDSHLSPVCVAHPKDLLHALRPK